MTSHGPNNVCVSYSSSGEKMTGTPLPAVKKVMQSGNSLSVNITQECKVLGIKRGDVVRITIERF